MTVCMFVHDSTVTAIILPVYTHTAEWQIDNEQCWLHLRPILGFNDDIHVCNITTKVHT